VLALIPLGCYSQAPMLTMFSVPKPCRSPLDVIQQNAIRSWRRVYPDAQLILFGDEVGTSTLAEGAGAEHEPRVALTPFGAPRLDDVVARADAAARFPLRCFVNSDVVLLDDHARALGALERLSGSLLAIGESWDVRIDGAIDFDDPNWSDALRLALGGGKTRGPFALDYAVYTPGLFKDMPPFALGRARADNWLVHHALAVGADVIDLTPSALALHQSHDYAHLPGGRRDAYRGSDAKRNQRLAGLRCYLHVHGLLDATHDLTGGVVRERSTRFAFGRQLAARGRLALVEHA
jgi:hypothetical protein